LQITKVVQNCTSFLHKFSRNFYHPLAIFLVDNSISTVICELEKQMQRGPPISGAETDTMPACRRVRGTSMPHIDRTRRRRAPLKASCSDSVVQSRLVRSRRRLVHAGEMPPHCRSLWCHRSIHELLHDTPVPTSPTTGATRRSYGLAPMSSSTESSSPPRVLSGEPLLPKMPQSSPPSHCVALATVPDPPHPRLTPESDRPSPPLLRAPTPPLPPHGPHQR
jgi:hypothetical protein